MTIFKKADRTFMKKIIIGCLIVFLVVLLVPQSGLAQGTLYLNNLDQPSTGSFAVGNDSWLAATFRTGNNAGGYVLDSIQLGMVGASGHPSDFTAMLYSLSVLAPVPGHSLATLNGSSDPSTVGVYTFNPSSSLTLSPGTSYFIVLTSGTSTANDAYEWSLSNGSSYNPMGGWGNMMGQLEHSSDGLSWAVVGNVGPQYAINATPVPEPSIVGLFCLGGAILLRRSREP
jgi:hypothetical protein